MTEQEKRSNMRIDQLEELKELLLDRMKVDHNYGRTAVIVDRDIMIKRHS